MMEGSDCCSAQRRKAAPMVQAHVPVCTSASQVHPDGGQGRHTAELVDPAAHAVRRRPPRVRRFCTRAQWRQVKPRHQIRPFHFKRLVLQALFGQSP